MAMLIFRLCFSIPMSYGLPKGVAAGVFLPNSCFKKLGIINLVSCFMEPFLRVKLYFFLNEQP